MISELIITKFHAKPFSFHIYGIYIYGIYGFSYSSELFISLVNEFLFNDSLHSERNSRISRFSKINFELRKNGMIIVEISSGRRGSMWNNRVEGSNGLALIVVLYDSYS